MFTVCLGLVFRSKYVQFPIICSLQYSININMVEVDPHSDILHTCIVKPKNTMGDVYYQSLLLFDMPCFIIILCLMPNDLPNPRRVPKLINCLMHSADVVL